MPSGDYRNWAVWQKSMELVTETYLLTKKFPAFEVHGLASQMQRAAVSIPSNLAEGYRRMSSKDSLHFYKISFGSAGELETQFEISRRLGYVLDKDLEKALSLILEVLKLLTTMIFRNRNL